MLQENSIKNDGGGEGAAGEGIYTKREMWETDYLQSVAFVSFFLEEGKKYGVFVSTRSCFALSSINPGYVHSIRKIALTENGPMILFYPQCLKMTKNVSFIDSKRNFLQ